MDIGQWVHFSIDDVIESLKWVYQNRPKSIFEEPMFGTLKKWHESYGINCDLYVFEMTAGFQLTDLQDNYWEELAKESDWLKLGRDCRKSGEITIVPHIRFDRFADGVTVKDYIDDARAFLNKAHYKKHLEIFCQEWKFMGIVSEIEQFWIKFSKIKIDLYMNASVLIGEYLYFTACNANFLFRNRLDGGETEVIAELPCVTYNSMKFSSLIYFENSIWMIPGREDDVIIYDMLDQKVSVLSLPYKKEHESGWINFRKAVRYEDYIWLLPCKMPFLIRINMKKRSIRTFAEWPKEVHFDKEEKMNFFSMCTTGKYLYLFRCGCSHNIRVNLKDGSMEILNMDIPKAYGVVTDEKLYISPISGRTPVHLYDLKEQGKETQYVLPQWVWAQEKFYAFWYAERVGNSVWFLPHEANAVIRMKLEDGSMNFISVGMEDYKTLRTNPEFAVYEAVEQGDGIWLVSYMGNKAIMINEKGATTKTVIFSASLSQLKRNCWKGSICYESHKEGLLQFLREAVWQNDDWVMEE